jgi:glucose dehydrogenase
MRCATGSILFLGLVLLGAAAPSPESTKSTDSRGDATLAGDGAIEWRHYAADRASSKYSPAEQIDRSNVAGLEIAWRFTTPDGKIETAAPAHDLKGTPLMVDGVLYAVSSLNLVSALDPSTGRSSGPSIRRRTSSAPRPTAASRSAGSSTGATAR